MVNKLIKNFLRSSGSNQFSLTNTSSKTQKSPKQKDKGASNNRTSDQIAGSVPTHGWDGSSVVLVGFKHYQPAIDDPLFIAVQHDEDAKHHDDSFKFPLNFSSDGNAISPIFEATSLAGVINREDRLASSCDNSDSAVASCILAYSEEFSTFLANSSNNTSNNNNNNNNNSISISEESPRSSKLFSSPLSNSSENNKLSQTSKIHLNSFSSDSSFSSFPEAINAFYPPPASVNNDKNSPEQPMDITDRFERSTTRRYQGSDLKRRTSSIQPFPCAFRVLLETGETRSFRYDTETTVNDILAQLQEKLNISVVQHFGFVLRRANEIVFVLPETMKISEFVDWCAANEYECSLRVVFPPKQPEDFLLVDPVAFDYLYTQCTNDVLAGRFESELGVDKAIYLSALHILQFAIASNLSGKLTTRRIDKEFGLEHFIPMWVRDRGRGRTIEHAVSESLRHLTERQRGAGQQNYKMQYVKLLSLMADYGAHAFPAVLLGFTEEKCSLLLGPNCGISYSPASLTQTKPVFLIRFEHIRCIGLNWSGQTPTNITCSVHHVIKDITPIQFLLPRWLKDSFLFVIRRYRRLLVCNNGDVTVIETTGENSSITPNGCSAVADLASSAINGLPIAADNIIPSSPSSQSKQSTNTVINNCLAPKSTSSSDTPTLATSNKQEPNNSNIPRPVILMNGQRSLTVRYAVKPTRQALLQLTIGQSNNKQDQGERAPSSAMRQSHFLLTESTSCPNICDLACSSTTSNASSASSTGEHHTEAESGIGSDMDSPRSHPLTLVSPPSSDDTGGNQPDTPAELLLEMRFEPPPGFGDSEDEGKFVVDNPLCQQSFDDDQPPPPPRRLCQPSPTSPPVSSATSRTHSIDDIVVSFNMALRGSLKGDEDDQNQLIWSPVCTDHGALMTCDSNNVVTVSLVDDMPPPPPEMNDTSDSMGYPPSECAPPPPPPYPFPLPVFDDQNIGMSSDSGTEEMINGTAEQFISPMPAPVLIAINNLPSDQLRATITRILLNRTQTPADVDVQLAATISDSTALRFSLSVFGTQDFSSTANCESSNDHDQKTEPNLAVLEEISDKLVNNCRAVLMSIGHSGKEAFCHSASDAVLAFSETATFLLDAHCNNVGATSLQRISQLSSALTLAIDAFNCCLQMGMSVIEEQMLTSTLNYETTNAFNEKLRQLLLNSAWLARSLAVFCSLSIQMKQDAAVSAGEVLQPAAIEEEEEEEEPQNNVNNTNGEVEASSEL